MRIEIIADTFDYFVTHAYRGILPSPAAEPQVPVIHQKVDAVIFRRDGIWSLFGNSLQDIRAFYIELIPARRTPIPHGSFPRMTSEDSCVRFFRDSNKSSGKALFDGDTLDDARTIAQLRESRFFPLRRRL